VAKLMMRGSRCREERVAPALSSDTSPRLKHGQVRHQNVTQKFPSDLKDAINKILYIKDQKWKTEYEPATA